MKINRWILGWLSICALTVHAQVPTREQLTGTWIGVRMAFDEQFYRPNPIVMTLGADSTYSVGLIDANSPVRQATWAISGQSMRLDTNTFALSQWALTPEELSLTGAYPMAFRRLTQPDVDSIAVHTTLSSYAWSTDSVLYHFHDDGSACLKNLKTGDVAVHCWRLARVERAIFVVIKGNRIDCDGNFQYPLQVTKLSTNEMQCRGGSYQTSSQLLFRRRERLAAESHCEPSGFQPCRTYLFPSFNLYPYFAYRRGRLFDIRQIVERVYKPIDSPGQSGLIRFRFVVNCRGEAGQFEVLEVNENYETSAFDPRIISQLNDICRTKLVDWESGRPNGETEPVDTVCLLSFRLKDGVITEIFP